MNFLQKIYKKSKEQKGFTLVEMIVVLVIIAILAAITIPALLKYIDKARDKQIVINARTAYLAAETAVSEAYAAGGKATDFVTDKSFQFGKSPTTTTEQAEKDVIKNAEDLTGLDKSSYTCKVTTNSQRNIIEIQFKDEKNSKVAIMKDGGSWTVSGGGIS